MSEFALGDKISVYRRGTAPSAIHSVAKIDKAKIVLSDGSTWTHRGKRWGTGNDPWGDRIRLTRPSDEETIERKRYVSYLEQRGLWEAMPIADLREIAMLVERIKRAQKDAAP